MQNAENNSVTQDTKVKISFSGGEGAQRITIDESLTLSELGIDLEVVRGKAPVHPTAKISEIKSGPGTDEEKKAQIEKLMEDFKKASCEFKAMDGLTEEDLIQVKVVDWLIANKNFQRRTRENADHKVPLVDEADITVIGNTNLAGQKEFRVNGTAVWGD